MMHTAGRLRLIVALVVSVLAVGWPGDLRAQGPTPLADALVRETYKAIREDALRPPDVLTLLHETVLTAEHALVLLGVAAQPLPTFTAQEDRDLTAAAEYVQATVDAAPAPRDGDKILATVLRAMVRAVADPLGAVFPPLDFIQYHRELRGEHTGIGAQVDTAGGQMIFADVTAGGPAAKAGISPGDVLLEVDGHSAANYTPDQLMDRLRGAAGTTVALVVRRAAGGMMRPSLIREVARENPTRGKILEPHVGYLRLLEFSEGASLDVNRSLSVLADAGTTALLLDLRENGGGLLDEAVGVASAFLSDGLVAMEERRGMLNPLTVVPQAHRFSGPVVVLVSNFTASASEVVAGALQDTGAPLVGARTFGKGTVQTIYPLPGGWGLRLTTARYYTRNGRSIDGHGLQPDHSAPMDEEQIQGPHDVQIQQAMTVLRIQMAAGPAKRP